MIVILPRSHIYKIRYDLRGGARDQGNQLTPSFEDPKLTILVPCLIFLFFDSLCSI